MNIEQKLKDIGLTQNEIKLYLYILEKGTSTPPQISKGLKITRSNIHYLLKSLIEKDLLKKQIKGKRYVYIPNDPSITLLLADRKRKAIEEIAPDLQALYKKNTNKPVIKFYEGVDEISHIWKDIVEMRGDKLFAFASIKKLFDVMPKGFPGNFQKEIKQKGIFFKEILSYESKNDAQEAKDSMLSYHEYKILPEKYSDFPTDMLVWDDSVALITLSEPVFGVVITNKSLADTYKIQFEIMWKFLEINNSII